MATRPSQPAESMSVDVDNLYREESYTDLHAASVRVLIPVTVDGVEDSARKRLFIGDTTLMTQMGPIPVQFPLEVFGTVRGATSAISSGGMSMTPTAT